MAGKGRNVFIVAVAQVITGINFSKCKYMMGHLLIIEALYSLWYKINAWACAAMGKKFNFGSVIASHRSVVFLELGWGGFFFLYFMPCHIEV